MDLTTAIHRMTGLPASILGLEDRGRIAAGAIADLVIFDPATVNDTSTYDEPTALPVGVEAVLLGGRFAIDGGRAVDPRLGRVLRRESQWTPPDASIGMISRTKPSRTP